MNAIQVHKSLGTFYGDMARMVRVAADMVRTPNIANAATLSKSLASTQRSVDRLGVALTERTSHGK